MGIFFGRSLLYSVWRPRAKPLLVDFVVLGIDLLALVGCSSTPASCSFWRLRRSWLTPARHRASC
jgi:hypothetical protein